ncbi:MAG: transposase [Ktedonobacteraceae bacterium]
MRYSLAFRNSILRKVLPPESRSVYQVAREAGISAITIHSWMSKLKEGKLELDPEGNDPTPRDWPVAQKFRLLMEGRMLDSDQRGEWLRTNGLHSEHLTLWEQELTNLMTDKQGDLKSQNKDLKKQVKDLEKELSRKEKAMAEVVALLVLKKKVDARFGVDEEDSIPPNSEGN